MEIDVLDASGSAAGHGALGPESPCRLLSHPVGGQATFSPGAALPLPTCSPSLCGKETGLIAFSQWLLCFFSGGKEFVK